MRPTLSTRAERQQLIAHFLAQLHSDTGSAPLLDSMSVLPLDHVLWRIHAEYHCVVREDSISFRPYDRVFDKEMDHFSRRTEYATKVGRYPFSFIFFIPELEEHFPSTGVCLVDDRMQRRFMEKGNCASPFDRADAQASEL
jgi:hypothetical protein